MTRYGYDIPHSGVASLAEGIESGTSGSPVVTADGLMLGIVSNSNGHSANEACGTMPACGMALPRWVWIASILARIGLQRANRTAYRTRS